MIAQDWPMLGLSEEITASWEQGPEKRYSKIMDRALELVQSVPYNVTLRWLFYNLWQEGWYSFQKPTPKASAKTRAYDNFSRLLARMLHSSPEFLERWQIELADDRRDPIHRTAGFRTAEEWLDHLRGEIECNIDKMIGQDVYLMVAFEAEAMQSQFEYYTEPYGVSLWPFSGMASIPYKKRLARHIEWAYSRFGLPVIVLYFGDYDEAGLTIPEASFRHIRKWCKCKFDAFRAGLNQDHVQRYNIPEDPERPGKFQWEAVADIPAKEIITGAIDSLLRHDAIRTIEIEESEMTGKAREALAGIE